MSDAWISRLFCALRCDMLERRKGKTMAQKQIYLVNEKEPYCRIYTVDYKVYSGFSLSQKQKTIRSYQGAYYQLYPGRKLLEVSSASEEELGRKLSAFNLLKYVPSLDRKIPLECIFQGGKVYESGGPYTDMYEMAPGEAKKDPRKDSSGRLKSFEFEGKRYPLEPKTLFYDGLYFLALKENPELAEQLLDYDGFTDVFFNPERAFNCQAISCARYVSLIKAGKLEEYLSDFERKGCETI